MDNTLKAFEVGNEHLYGHAHAQAIVGSLRYECSLLY